MVRFNHWLEDPVRREHMAGLLGGTFDDSSLSRVSAFGGGSSFATPQLDLKTILSNWKKVFDVRTYADLRHWEGFRPRAPEDMNVHERWRRFAADPTFRRMVSDAEVLELSEELFGEIPGTREFIE